jgi:hypothetical protein
MCRVRVEHMDVSSDKQYRYLYPCVAMSSNFYGTFAEQEAAPKTTLDEHLLSLIRGHLVLWPTVFLRDEHCGPMN